MYFIVFVVATQRATKRQFDRLQLQIAVETRTAVEPVAANGMPQPCKVTADLVFSAAVDG